MHTTAAGRQSDPSSERPSQLPRATVVYTPSGQCREVRSHPLRIGATAVGRELPDGDGIQLPDSRASRIHAQLHVSADLSVAIADGHSKNGTFVNGQRLPAGGSRRLRYGDVLRVGDCFLVLCRAPAQAAGPPLPLLEGPSAALQDLGHEIRRIAAAPMTVLVQGETGTGKEVVARALHQLSQRRGEFVAVNCGAIPESLAESQLFGHVSAAGTARAHLGCFRAAHEGTLFLDEVGALPLPLQARLLRVLEERAVTPVGATRAIPCDVRLVAATNRDLSELIASGRFGADLYTRLAGSYLHLPPLRERREDILFLLQHALGAKTIELLPRAVEALLLYDWPLNVREILQIADHLRLRGVNEALFKRLSPPPPAAAAAVTLRTAAAVASKRALPAAVRPTGSEQPEEDEGSDITTGRSFRLGPMPGREELVRLMQKHQGVVSRVAAELKCSRRHVGRLLAKHGLDLEALRRGSLPNK